VRRGARTLAAAVALAAPACSDGPSGLTASELLGLWAAVEMVYTSQADPSVRADLVGAEGATYSIELRSDATFESQLSGWMTGTLRESGTFEVRDDRLHLAPAGRPGRTLDLDFNRALLTAYEAEGSWDFDGDGALEPATLHMVLDRF
jgi:hypothetical protein